MRVETCPDAGMYHEQASWNSRRDSESTLNPEAQDLAAGMRVVQMHSSVPTLTGIRLRLINRAHYIQAALAKDTGRTRLYSQAAKAFAATKGNMPALLALTAPIKRNSVHVPKKLLPGRFWGISQFMQWVIGKTEGWWRRLIGSTVGIGIDDLTSDETDNYRYRKAPLPLVGIMSVMLALCTVIACRGLIGMGQPVSAALLPAPDSLSAAWNNWIVATPGLSGANAPWLAVMAVGSTLAAGQPALFVWLVLFSAVAGAFATCYHLMRRIVNTGFALLLATVWAMLLPTSGLLRSGSLSGITVMIVLPVLAIGLYSWARGSLVGLAGLQPPGQVAVCGTVLGAVSPAVLLGVMGAAVVVATFRRDLRGALVVVSAPTVVLAPWIPRLLADPARIFTGVDGAAMSADSLPGVLSLLAARFVNAAPWWVTFGAILVLLIGFLAAGRAELPAKWRRVLLVGMVLTMLLGVALSRSVFYIGAVPVRGFGVFWILSSLLIALALIAGWLRSASNNLRVNYELRSAGVGILLIYSAISTIWWIGAGAGEPLQLRTTDALPGYITAVEHSPRATRTLSIVTTDAVASVSIKDAEHPIWGDGESDALRPEALRDTYLELAQQLADGIVTDRLVERLENAGIGHIVMIGAPTPVILSLQGVPGLVGVLEVDDNVDTYVFTIAGVSSRMNTVTAGVQTPLERAEVSVDSGFEQLLLLEQADSDWEVTVGGVALPAVTSDTGLALFELGTATGVVEWRLKPTWSWVIWELVAVVVLFWLAAPASVQMSRTEPRRGQL
jgi:hypothetical protein